MRRIAFALSVVSMLLLLDAPAARAGGGPNPPNTLVKVSGPTVNGIILMDPNCQALDTANPPKCIAGGPATATVWLNKGQGQTSIKLLSTFKVVYGCNADLSGVDLGNPITRFLFTVANESNLTDWVPPFELQSLFLPLGISTFPAASVWPAITQINSAQCVQSPAGAGRLGWLLMDVTIQFLVPVTK